METKKKPETLKKGHKARAKKAQEDRFKGLLYTRNKHKKTSITCKKLMLSLSMPTVIKDLRLQIYN